MKISPEDAILLSQAIPSWVKDPKLFCEQALLFTPDEWQRDILNDLNTPGINRITIKSGQGVGKTGTVACCALWFLFSHENSRVVATAPTMRQLNDVLWPEISKWMGNSPILTRLMKWTKTYVYVKGAESRWFAVARTATKPENMQGFHEEHMLFIVDEASGVDEQIM